jgi:putative DNA primase/helicase
LPFNRIFTKDEQDPDLTSKLIEEHPGILNWALEGLKKWQKSQLSLPKIMQIEVETYRTESDVIGLWLSEKCETGRTLTATAEDLYRSYNFWCECNGHQPGSQTRLGRQLSERGFTKEKGARITWRGLAVKKLSPGGF